MLFKKIGNIAILSLYTVMVVVHARFHLSVEISLRVRRFLFGFPGWNNNSSDHDPENISK